MEFEVIQQQAILILNQRPVLVYSIISSLIFYFAFFWLSHYLSPKLSKSYNDLTKLDQNDWNTRPMNIFYSAYISLFIIYVVVFTDVFSEIESVDPPIILRTSESTQHVLGHSMGFFVVDSFFVLVYGIGGALMLVHHVAAFICVALGCYQDQVHYYIMLMLVTEMTTPFIQARWLMAKADMKESNLYILNGVACFVLWIFGRLLIFPYFFWSLWQHWEQMQLVYWMLQTLIVGVPILLFTLNIYWFTKICAGIYKLLFVKEKEE